MNVLSSKEELITLQYGEQMLNGNSYKHTGIDFVRKGYQLDEIIACEKGKVINVEKNILGYKSGSYGNFVHIQHGGIVSTVYAHMKLGTVCVNIGDVVEKGDVIGYMGATGFVTGAHLHFEIRENNITVDPNKYLDGEKNIPIYNNDIFVRYEKGKYQTMADYMRVRDGVWGNIKEKKQLTLDGQKNSYMNGNYKIGTVFDALEIINANDASVWAKTPSGYVCIKDGSGKEYCKKI